MRVTADPECLYFILYAPRERLDDLLVRLVQPVAAEIQGHPGFDSLFFVRYSEPRWQLRFRILGKSAWLNASLREDVERRVRELEKAGEIESHEVTRYDREYDRYGGEVGMRLAERLFHLDSLACLELVRRDKAGALKKSRRELALVLVDRLLDLTPFTLEDRLEFYRFGFAWALEQKTWGPEDLDSLEQRFRKIRDGLERLMATAEEEDPIRIFLRDARPVVDSILLEHGRGAIRQDLRFLFWSYAHMMTNRLGVEANPEAILRFFMFRLLEERSRSAA